MKLELFALAAVASATAFAVPTVSNVTMSQTGGTVAIGYTLSGGPAIVTVDIRTNGVSIGGQYLTHFSGDVNRLVDSGARSCTWKPNKAWPCNRVIPGVAAVVQAWSKDAPPDYMAVSLVQRNTVRFYTCAESVPGGVTNDLYKTEILLMHKCPAANVRWRRGAPTNELGRENAREGTHYVTLDSDFYLGIYPFTQMQYINLTGQNPSLFVNRHSPVEKVSYEMLRGKKADGYDWPNDGTKKRNEVDPDGVIGRLRTYTGLNGLDLPTEAQWEFAYRAKHGEALYTGHEIQDTVTCTYADEIAWYASNSANQTHPVGQKVANDWGFFDMPGNTCEWCLDWYKDSITDAEAVNGPTSGSNRSRRGCSYGDKAFRTRGAWRAGESVTTTHQAVGFRMGCAVNPF